MAARANGSAKGNPYTNGVNRKAEEALSSAMPGVHGSAKGNPYTNGVNGNAGEDSSSAMPGANGLVKGNPYMSGVNGSAVEKSATRRRAAKKSPGFLAWLFSIVARLSTWAAIITILFRCPNSLDACDDTSPYICKHYYNTKNFLTPHVQPYYDRYAGPYVDVTKPYYDSVNQRVLTPARDCAIQYGAPWIEKGQQFAQARWEQTAQPRLVQLQTYTQDKYDQTVAPHALRASDAVSPYYRVAKDASLQAYDRYLLPGYILLKPYAAHGYDVTADFATNTALPTASWAYNKTFLFVDTTVWPQICALYSENVEPQLVRIGERLGRYKNRVQTNGSETATVRGVPEAVQSSIGNVVSQASSAYSSATSSMSTVIESATSGTHKLAETHLSYVDPVQAPSPASDETDKRKTAREMVADDLALWQAKFAAQADEGATEMQERIDEIAHRMVAEHVNSNGQGLVSTLKATIESEIEILKSAIKSIVGESDGSTERAEDSIVQAIRSTGVAIRDKAQGLRDWHQKYNADLQKAVVEAAEVHFQMLDETRSLALQQIGMKWAWAEGVTYKDWAKYHELKSTLNQWTEQLKESIVSHPTLLEAQDAAGAVEEEGMQLAADAAKELTGLKEASHYKVLANDVTDEFDSEVLRRLAEEAMNAKNAAEEEARRAAAAVPEDLGEASSSLESLGSEAAETVTVSLTQAAEMAQEAVAESKSSLGETAEDVSSSLESAKRVATDAAGEQKDRVSGDVQSVAAVLGDEIAALQHGASRNAEDVAESASSVAGDMADKVTGSASSTMKPVAEEIDPVAEGGALEIEEDIMTEREETPPSDTPSVKPAFLGAAAQSVPSRQPILDDYVDTDMVASATAGAQSAYSNAVSAASQQYASAMSVVSAQVYGTPKPVHEQLFSSVGAAYENAVSAAGDRLSNAKEAVSAGMNPTPTTTATAPTGLDWSKVESVAANRLNEGRLWAELQYSSALIAMGLATATPTSSTDKYVKQAKLNYYAGLGLAQERYASFMSAASSAFSSMTATPTPTDFAGTASSMASVASASAVSAANAAEEAAESAYAAATDSMASIVEDIEGSVASAVDGAAEQMYLAGASMSEMWDNVVGELNERIYGGVNPMIGWYDSLLNDAGLAVSSATEAIGGQASAATDAASDSAATASAAAQSQYDAATSLISELIVGKEPAFTESVMSRLGAAYATATAKAASVGEKVGSAASQATEAVKETVQSVRDEL